MQPRLEQLHHEWRLDREKKREKKERGGGYAGA